VERLVQRYNRECRRDFGRILAAFPCDVGCDDDVARLFRDFVPSALLPSAPPPSFLSDSTTVGTTGDSWDDKDDATPPAAADAAPPPLFLSAVVHSVAYADLQSSPTLLRSSWDDYADCQRVSAYSLVRVAREAQPLMMAEAEAVQPPSQQQQQGQDESATNGEKKGFEGDEEDTATATAGNHNKINNCSPGIVALTYAGSSRVVPNYSIMGPAKASLESVVRGLAYEFGRANCDNNDYSDIGDRIIRVNAVSAGPVSTLASRAIPRFQQMLESQSPSSGGGRSMLGRPVTKKEIADAVRFLASPDASGITGQVVFVDGGASVIL